MEGILWLLLTGEVPTAKEVDLLRADLVARSEVPTNVLALIKSLPTVTFSIPFQFTQQQTTNNYNTNKTKQNKYETNKYKTNKYKQKQTKNLK